VKATRWLLAAGLAAAAASRCAAHERNVSHSSWIIRGREAHVLVRFAEIEFGSLPDDRGLRAGEDPFPSYLVRHLALHTGDRPCAVQAPPQPLPPSAGQLAYEWRLECDEGGALRLRSTLLADVAPLHVHFARVELDGKAPVERVLVSTEREWTLGANDSTSRDGGGTTLWGYAALGVEHILTGYDHIAFVLALLLVASRLREVALVVTGFTVAHSLTLGLTALGYLQAERAPIEALIGLSIALVAAENAWLAAGRPRALPWVVATGLAALALAAARDIGRVPASTLGGLALFTVCYFGLVARASHPARLRWCVAFVFGLVHGFGFAGVVLDAQLPAGRVVRALFGFNAGVELGQLAVVAIAWPLFRLLAGRPSAVGPRLLQLGTATVFAMGVFWFLSRSYG